MQIRSVRDADVAGKRVLVRIVLNVPLESGVVMDDTRLKAIIPTLDLLRQKGAKEITLMGYVGRPDGKVVEELRVAPIAKRLGELTDMTKIVMLENLRFDPREEANDPIFAKELASHGDLYVNDAFPDDHRAYASTVGVAALLPSYAGLQLQQEIEHLSLALTPPAGSVAVIAVTKPDKITLVEKLARVYDKVLVGGPVADYRPAAPNIIVPTDGIPELKGLLDIGPTTRAAYVEAVSKAPFVLWNGPLGWYEKGYIESTDEIAKTIISTRVSAVIGGGDTINALKKYQFDSEKVFLSTGGGAMLEFLAAGTLPGIKPLAQQ
jgi:phosphoglycerate kinase